MAIAKARPACARPPTLLRARRRAADLERTRAQHLQVCGRVKFCHPIARVATPTASSASRPSSANAARSRCRRTLCSRIGEREPARAAAATAAVPDRPQPSAACLGTCRRSASSPVALTSPQLTTFVTKSLQCAGGARFRSRSECRRRDRSGTARRSCEVSLPPRTGSSVRSAYWAPVTRRKARACRRLLGATGRQTLQSSPCGDYTTNQCAGATTQVGGVCYLCVQLSTACAPGKQW